MSMVACSQGGWKEKGVQRECGLRVNQFNERMNRLFCLLQPQPVWSASQHSGVSETSLKSPSHLIKCSPVPSDQAHRKQAHH